MPSALSRLRLWFGISTLLMIAVVAGFYLYARYRVERAVRDLPAKLGVNIQQNTEGFTYSQAAGGHTIFSITASNAIRYKEGGKAELHKVRIVSYGRNSDRLDEISGDDFEYEAQSGDVTAKGKVEIQLQAVQAGTSTPSGHPVRIGSPVHLDTSGLIFNQKTGVARTSNKIAFQLPQGTGWAMGAVYSSKQNTFNLISDIHLFTTGPKPMNIAASSALFRQDAQELTLTDLEAESGPRRMDAQHVILHLRDDNTVERADASGGVNLRVQSPRGAVMHAANAIVTFGADNRIADAHLAGGVRWETTGETVSHGNAGQVLIAFAANNQIKSAQLRNSVDLVQVAAGQDAQGVEFRGDGLDLKIADGRSLETANSVGTAQILLSNARSALAGTAPAKSATASKKTQTLITAGRFDAKFTSGNRLSALTGNVPVKIVSSTAGQPDRVSQSHDLLATFTKGKTQALEDAIQTGNVQIDEGQRSASADRATFHQPTESMTLSGNVRYKDAQTGAALTSNTLALNRASGETVAMGEVKTTYAEQQAQPSGGMLSPSQAVHVTAPEMDLKNSIGQAKYSGGARLWQAGNVIQAPVIEFDRNDRTLTASSQDNRRVSTVFLQAGKNGKDVPVEVGADQLQYDDAQRRALFEGSVVLRNADSTLHANKTIVILRAESERQKAGKGPSSGAPSEVQSIEANGNILLEQPGRRATGERLVYTANEQKFVLTGTPGAPPSIFDAEHGQVTGVSLTFFNHDGRVLVDSSNSTSITQTRFKK